MTRRQRVDRVLWYAFTLAAVINVIAAVTAADTARAGLYGWASVACIACALTFVLDSDAERLRARVEALESERREQRP